jgi:cytochrome b6-f complex iron-sulfur subunit
MSHISRRDFLKLAANWLLAASGILGLGAVLRFLSHTTEPAPKTEFDLGLASSYPVGSRSMLSAVPALLIHTESGFSALSLVCTHLGCTVESKDNGFACPCHGSLYGNDGNVLRGPAQKPLRALRVEQNSNGNLILFTD